MAIDNKPGWGSTQSKLRWGELEEDDGEDLDFLLPPRQVIGPDDNGIEKVIEYKFNDDGNKVKITTTTRIRKLAKARLSKRAIERRSWAKFGDAVHEDVGSRLTMVSTEEILIERPRAPGSFLPLFFFPPLRDFGICLFLGDQCRGFCGKDCGFEIPACLYVIYDYLFIRETLLYSNLI